MRPSHLILATTLCCTPLASGQTTFLELLGDTDGEQFGRALTTTGDLTGDGRGEILVGAPYADGGGDASGEVRLFSGHDGTLLLTNAGQAAEEFCGWALAAGDLDGDGLDELLLGSPGHAPGGRLRIIHGSDGSAFRSHVHSEADASYASSLAILEDLNGDGRPEYAVGAWGHDGAGTDAGLVEVYSGSDGALLFSVLGAAPGDELGYSLAGVADLSGDGIPDLILGARRSDGAGINAGSVRVVSGADGSDLYQLDGTAPGDAFGQSVTGLGDVDGDGLGDYAVGAHHGDTAGYNAGTVTIHSGGTGGILATIHGDTANQALGQTLARAGDLDGDGTQDLLAGAPSLDGTSYASGHASAYSGTTGLELFRLDGAQFLERLGQGLSPAGDIDLDGFPDFLVGAPGFSSSGVSAGTVLLISLHENVPPTAGADEFTIQEDTPAALAVLANDQDSDGTLDPASVTLIADPSHGSASVDSTTGLVSYTPALNYFGSDSFTYTVADNDGASSPETVVAITVQDVNDSPVAVDDSADTLEDTSVTISILANDSDVDGILRPESVEILTAPAHGSLSLDEVSGALTYQPGQDAEDTAVFTYRVADDDGDFTNAATVTVSITEINDAPVAISDGPVTDEDTPLAVDVLANDYDVDGSLIPASVQLHAHPTIGTASVDPLTGQVTYIPKPEWSGNDSFSYSVADDDGERSAEALATLTVIDVNDIPVALGDAALLPPGQQSTIDVLLNDYDTDGSLVPGSVVISSPPQDGAASVDALTGAITYVPDVGFEGPDQLAYTVSDDDGDASLPGTLSLLVTSDCNGNGYPDGTDIANGTSQDCNGNGIPDECDLAGGNSQDCDGNGLADSCDANAYFVDATASCNGNGTAQAPFCAIQSAIDVAQNGMSVVVAPGVYTQALDMRGKRIHLVACQGPQVTIVDAGAAGVAILCQSGESEQTIIEGFTFTNGSSTWAGGGAYVSQGNPLFENCWFVGNASTSGGGAFIRNNAQPIFSNCRFADNSASINGGGLSLEGGSALLVNCEFSDNRASDHGGAIFLRNNATLSMSGGELRANQAQTGNGGGLYSSGGQGQCESVTMADNIAAGHGGGAYLENNSHLSLVDCSLQGNRADMTGGGIRCDVSSPLITGCSLTENEAGTNGGGLHCRNGSAPVVTRTLIADNRAAANGGGAYLGTSSPTFEHCTFSGNQALSGGGVFGRSLSRPIIHNSILWGDGPDELVLLIGFSGSPVPASGRITWSDIGGGFLGAGNLNVDPLFVDPQAGNYQLQAGSPCIDAGDPASPGDPDGSRSDMGAFAHQ